MFSSWLPSFYDELLLYLEQEWKWYFSISLYNFSVSELVDQKDKSKSHSFLNLMNFMAMLPYG